MRNPKSANPRQQSIYVPSVQFWERVKEAALKRKMTASGWLCRLAEREMGLPERAAARSAVAGRDPRGKEKK